MERKAVYMCTEYSVVYIGITNEKRKFFLNDKNRAHTFIMFLSIYNRESLHHLTMQWFFRLNLQNQNVGKL